MAVRNNPFRPLIKKIPGPFRNKFFLILIIFFAWMIFFDKHDVLTQFRLQQTMDKMEQDREYYKKNIRTTLQDKKDLQDNKEKFAREHYNLQKDDEDVFIFVEQED